MDDAREALRAAEALAARVGEARLSVCVRLYGARAALAGGDPPAAIEEAARAAEEAEANQLPGLRALAISVAARAHLARGEVAAADEASAEALRIRDELGALEEDEAEVFLVRARALEAADRFVDGHEVRERGRARLRALADQIADATLRVRFLEDVPAHRDLMAGA